MAIGMSSKLISNIIEDALLGRDHRDWVIEKIDTEFLGTVETFLSNVTVAKASSNAENTDWYLTSFPEIPRKRSCSIYIYHGAFGSG